MKAWRLGRSSFCSGRKYFSYRPSSTGLTDMAACARRGNNPQLWDRKRERRENETPAQKLQVAGQPKGVFKSNQPAIYTGDGDARLSGDDHNELLAQSR